MNWMVHSDNSKLINENDYALKESFESSSKVTTKNKDKVTEHSGSKYLRDVTHLLIDDKLDVYSVLAAFNVTCPARQHAIKKLLCSGIRGKGDVKQDLCEARDAVDRAIDLAISS